MWHGEAIAKVLSAHGETSGQKRIVATSVRDKIMERLGPIPSMIGSAIMKERFIAVHMTWGAVNEWTTQSGYAALAAKADHPELTKLLKAIMKQEGRHIAFYSTEAKKRLADSNGAQKATRFLFKTQWGPVGSGIMPEEEVKHLAAYLYDGEQGLEALRRIDSNVQRLPGLEELTLLKDAFENLAVV